MNPLELLALFTLVAVVLHLLRPWPKLAAATVLLATAILTSNVALGSTNSFDVLSVSLAEDAAARDLVTFGVLLTGALALTSIFSRDRIGLSFLFLSWVPWFVALVVNDYVVGVVAWTLGQVLAVFGMKPRRHHRASGAANYLVILAIAAASLLFASRLVILYQETPERTNLIQLAVLFLCWGFGLAFSLVPFQFWVGPMTDDAPLTTTAAVLAFGQPIGLLLLFRFLNQNLWLTEKSNLIQLMALGGLLTTVAGGLFAAVERRAGRLIGYAAIFSFGIALLDLSRATDEGLAYSGLEIFSRAIGLTMLACAVTIGREVESVAVRRVALAAAILAGFNLVGLRLGVSLDERWNTLLQLAGTDTRFLAVLILAHMGLLVGVIRFARQWFLSEPSIAEAEFLPPAVLEALPAFQSEQVPAAIGVTGFVSQPIPPSFGNGGLASHAGVAEDAQVPLEAGTPDSTKIQAVNSGENGRGEDGNAEGVEDSAQEYVFEDHMREIAKTIVERARPYVLIAARSLPAGTLGLVKLTWETWRTWVSIALLLALIGLLLAFGLAPGAWFERAAATIGQPPLVQ